MFRIAAYARLAGVSAKMLRAWDALGLFHPAWTDGSSGYRYYSPAQLPELRRILALRDLGLPLADVTGLIAGGADLRPVLERRRRELEAERREVERRLQALEISVAMADMGAPGPDVVLQRVSRELVATLAVGPDGDDNAAFHVLETVVRDLGLRAGLPPAMLVGRHGPAGPLPDEVVVPVTARFAPRDGIVVRDLPACRVAAVIHRGPYAGLAEVGAALERWVATAGLRAARGLRIVYLQFGAEAELRVPPAYVVDRADDFVTELQLELA